MKLGMLITGIILVIVGVILGVVGLLINLTANDEDIEAIWVGITMMIVALATFIAGFVLSLVGAHRT